MAVKTLADLLEPFLGPYKGSYNDRLYAWIQAGAPGWAAVIDPDGNGTPGGSGPGGGGTVNEEDIIAIVQSYLSANPVEVGVGLADLPAGITITIMRNGDGTWPPRPTIRTDIYVIWLDKTNLPQSDPGGYLTGPDTILDKGSA